jgi:transcriptional regulator with XRE-family HTH domain
MSIGGNIRYYREEADLTQQQLSERCGISVSSIKKYEKGINKPKIEHVGKIAQALFVHPEKIYGKDAWNALWEYESTFEEKTLAEYSTDELLAELKRRCKE